MDPYPSRAQRYFEADVGKLVAEQEAFAERAAAILARAHADLVALGDPPIKGEEPLTWDWPDLLETLAAKARPTRVFEEAAQTRVSDWEAV